MLLPPSCGLSLQKGVMLVSILEFFISAGFFLGGLIIVQKFANASNQNYEGDIPMLLFGIAYLIFAVVQFLLACFLLHGSNKKSIRHCAKWFLGSWIFLVILITFAACETYQGRLTAGILWVKPVFLGFTSLFKLYCIWVVYAFMNGIPKDDQTNESSHNLKEAENGNKIIY